MKTATLTSLPAAERRRDARRESATESERMPAEPRSFPIRLLSAGVLISVLFGFVLWLWTAMLVASVVAAWLLSPIFILALGALFGDRLNRQRWKLRHAFRR